MRTVKQERRSAQAGIYLLTRRKRYKIDPHLRGDERYGLNSYALCRFFHLARMFMRKFLISFLLLVTCFNLAWADEADATFNVKLATQKLTQLNKNISPRRTPHPQLISMQ